MNIERIKPGVWNTRAVVHGDLVFLSGIVADDKSLSMKGQTEQVLAKIDEVLAAAGTSKSRILTSTVYLADIDAKDEMNEAWMAWIDKDQPAGPRRHRRGAHPGHPGGDHGLRGEIGTLAQRSEGRQRQPRTSGIPRRESGAGVSPQEVFVLFVLVHLAVDDSLEVVV